MNIKNMSSREKLLFSMSIGAILLYGCIILIFNPCIQHWKKTSDEILKAHIKLSKGQYAIKQRVQIEKMFSDLMDNLSLDDSEDNAIGKAQQEILNTAKKNEITVTDLKAASLRDMDCYKICSLDFSCEGTLKQLVPFIYGLESCAQLLRIQRITLIPTTQSEKIQCSVILTKLLLHKTTVRTD